MSIDNLISRLDRVKTIGKDKWLACCPAHKDKSPSLSIKELDDGRVLIHCFAGCDVESILNSLSLDVSELFPQKQTGSYKPHSKPFSARDVLMALWSEVLVVALAAEQILVSGLSEIDRERLIIAVARIHAGLTVAGVSHA